MREVCNFGLKQFLDENSKHLFVWDYILKHPSVLVQQALLGDLDDKVMLNSLVLEAKWAKAMLAGVLGLGSNYKESNDAMKAILAAGRTVKQENVSVPRMPSTGPFNRQY